MNKRSVIPDVYKSRKKICTSRQQTFVGKITDVKNNKAGADACSNAKAALILLYSLFPVEKFDSRLPPIIFKHQLYSLIKNKSDADRQLNELHSRGEIRYIHLGAEDDDVTGKPIINGANSYRHNDLCIVFNEDYVNHVRKRNENNSVVEKFLDIIGRECLDVFVNRDGLTRFQIRDDEISELFKAGVLTVRDVGSWWISIPGAGEFMKCFTRGRKSVLLMIRKSKYGEILQRELETRKLPKIAKLGVQYHIHDIIGAELVYCINTTSGRLLRTRD